MECNLVSPNLLRNPIKSLPVSRYVTALKEYYSQLYSLWSSMILLTRKIISRFGLYARGASFKPSETPRTVSPLLRVASENNRTNARGTYKARKVLPMVDGRGGVHEFFESSLPQLVKGPENSRGDSRRLPANTRMRTRCIKNICCLAVENLIGQVRPL